MAPPADEPHGRAHLTLAYVLGAHVASGWVCAVDMLTRTGHDSDFAPDASVYPEARDPRTGGREIEELAFEIAAKQPLKVTTDKARELSRRGVRRVFCVLVLKARVLEWSATTDAWSPLADNAVIADRCFVQPLPVGALLDATRADAAVVAALTARAHPAIGNIRARELRAALLTVFSARGLRPTRAQRATIAAETKPRRLRRWIAQAAVASSVDEALHLARRR